ncbi:MAG: hypothetical protein GY870_19115, partial [archaeon]|nr:hypothetical protein [archaeon]
MNENDKKINNRGEPIKIPYGKHFAFVICFIIIASSSILAFSIQNNLGTINVSIVTITDENGYGVQGKLYKPVSATASNP